MFGRRASVGALAHHRDCFQCCLHALRRHQAWAILISPRVLVAVEDAVKVEPVGEFEGSGGHWRRTMYWRPPRIGGGYDIQPVVSFYTIQN
jgi:hypothetical protein